MGTKGNHPVFDRVMAGPAPSYDGGPRYLTLADTARLIRDRLAKVCPGTKFYVRSHSYSGGASIDVWYDGAAPGAPSRTAVDALLSGFRGGDFDGMIDMAYGLNSWLAPNGTASLGRSPGTVGSAGVHPAYDMPAPVAGAVLVHMGTNFVFVNDRLPYDVTNKGVGA